MTAPRGRSPSGFPGSGCCGRGTTGFTAGGTWTRRVLPGQSWWWKPGGESFALPIDPTGFARYNNLITLDVGGRQLLYGQPWWRQPLLVVLRVALTLALEGLIFYLWGYQEKRSWIIFLVVNLVTQFGVNIAILCFLPAASRTYDAMWAKVLLYGPMEVLVILLEAIALPLLLKEQRKGTAVGCSVMANILSWFLGAVLLSVLPV